MVALSDVTLVSGGVIALVGFFIVIFMTLDDGDDGVRKKLVLSGMFQMLLGLQFVFNAIVPPGTLLYSILGVMGFAFLFVAWMYWRVRRAERRERNDEAAETAAA